MYTIILLFLILSFMQNICILSDVELVISILIINISKLSFLCSWCRIIRSHLPYAFYCLQVYEEDFEDTGNQNRVNLVTKPVTSHEYKKRSGSVYDKWNISMDICDTADIP